MWYRGWGRRASGARNKRMRISGRQSRQNAALRKKQTQAARMKRHKRNHPLCYYG